MKKILLLSAAACMLSSVHAEDGESAGGHGFYVGGGLLFCNSGEKVDYTEPDGFVDHEANGYSTRLGGTLLFGYQKVLSDYPVCLGLELGGDFSPKKEELNASKTSTRAGRVYDLKTSRNGFTPFAALRIGYINHDHKFMTYLKVGISYEKSQERYDEYDFNTGDYLRDYSGSMKLTSWMPTVAIGLEKSIGKDLTGRVEGEYRFAKSKTKHFSMGGNLKLTQKGTLNIRALVCYNIKI